MSEVVGATLGGGNSLGFLCMTSIQDRLLNRNGCRATRQAPCRVDCCHAAIWAGSIAESLVVLALDGATRGAVNAEARAAGELDRAHRKDSNHCQRKLRELLRSTETQHQALFVPPMYGVATNAVRWANSHRNHAMRLQPVPDF